MGTDHVFSLGRNVVCFCSPCNIEELQHHGYPNWVSSRRNDYRSKGARRQPQRTSEDDDDPKVGRLK